MAEASVSPAAPIRHTALNCLIRVGSIGVPARTTFVGVDRLQVRAREGHFRDGVPAIGTVVPFRVSPPGRSPALNGSARLLWSGPAGSGTVLLELEPQSSQEEVASWLRRFVYEFKPTVLLVDPDAEAGRALVAVLQEDCLVRTVTTGHDALQLIEAADASALIVHSDLPDMSGRELLRRCGERFPELPWVLVSSEPITDPLKDRLEVGAISYYLTKPYRPAEVRQAVRRALDAHALALENQRLYVELNRVHQKLSREHRFLRERVQSFHQFEHLIGHSMQFQRVLADLERVRTTDTTVHIQGETGTGKELIARALHSSGPRASRPFVAVNCAGVSEQLLQSTLFGHRRGAFTGADRDHPGVFEQADGGTLFLDEVAELSPVVQAALLRVLQEGEFVPLGATRPVQVNVRIISSTHTDMRAAVKEGRFREDLFFRLVVLAVNLPALRERRDDVPLLAQHFLGMHRRHHGKRVRGFSPAALEALCAYPWPGNVRELDNEIERAVVLCDDDAEVDVALLSADVRAACATHRDARVDDFFIPADLTYDEAMQTLERILVRRALEATGGNLTRAAEALKVERSRLGKIRARLKLDGPGGGGEVEP